MRQFLIVSLFAILLLDLMLGIGFGLAPGLSLKNALLYILFIALVLDITVGGRNLMPEAWPVIGVWTGLIGYALFTWLGVSLLGIHRGYDMVFSFIVLKNQLIDLFLFFLLFLYGPRTPAQALALAKWLVGAIAVANLVTFLDVFNIPDLGIMVDRPDSRVAGPIGGVNQYGAVLAFIIPITAGFAVATRRWTRLFFQIGALIALVLLGLTISRGAFVGLVAGITITLIAIRKHITKKSMRRGLLIGVVAVVLVSAAVAIHDPEAFVQRFDFQAAATVNRMSSGRIDTWSRAVTMISQAPATVITGFGWNAYSTLFLGYGDIHSQQHGCWRIDGHTGRDLVQGDAVKEAFHIG